MLLSMPSEAGEYFSTSSVVAGRRVGIDVGMSKCHPSGNETKHRRSREHAGKMGK